MANGFLISEPAVLLMAMGNVPKIVVSALSSTGRKRVTALGRNLPVRHITPPSRLDHYGKIGAFLKYKG
jgi:hypothetical protein